VAARPSDAGCVEDLDLDWTDSGSTWCVRLGGQVAVDTMGPDGVGFSGIDTTGSSLTIDPRPMPYARFVLKATSRGTTVIFGNMRLCTDGRQCPSPPPWSVTVVVK